MFDFLPKLGDWIVWAIIKLFALINAVVAPIMDAVFSAILAGLPSSAAATASAAASVISPYINVVNYWIPLDFALGLLSSYIAIAFSVIGYRLIIKLIPTIG